MKNIRTLHVFDQIKLLSDARRMTILRLLMAKPATLSQLGYAIGQSPAWVQHHIKTLQAAGLVEIAEVRSTGIVLEKYYRAVSGGFLLQEIVLPKGDKPCLIVSGSHDLALELLAERLEKYIHILSLPVGSLDGLVNLRQGLCQFSGAHILDETGEYNTPIARRIFPERNIALFTLAYRTQGLLVAAGNPKGIKNLADLGREDITFLNRNPGSGTRIWLERELARLRLPPASICGYGNFVRTHSESAGAVQRGEADVSLGIQAAARESGLSFVPLFEERYDLVIPLEQQAVLTPLLDDLQTSTFRQAVEAMTGYNMAHSGEQIPL
jgi:putative molybdopterin biosynthesis protein